MKAERAKWEAEVEELRREANKKPSAKHTAQQQINFNEAMRKTSEAKDRKIDELQKEIEALRKQQQHNGGNLSRYVILFGSRGSVLVLNWECIIYSTQLQPC